MADLRAELARRKTWFFETQLRHINLDAFRGAVADGPKETQAWLDLASEPAPLAGASPGESLAGRPRVHLDSGRPVWTADEKTRHDAFARTLLGAAGDWLGRIEPARLRAAVAELREASEGSRFGSIADQPKQLAPFPRSQPSFDPAEPRDEGVGPAISRAELAAAKPWLIPELYNGTRLVPGGGEVAKDPAKLGDWADNLEQFLREFELELRLAGGHLDNIDQPPHYDSSAAYRAEIAELLGSRDARPIGGRVATSVLELVVTGPEDKAGKWVYSPSLATLLTPPLPVNAFPLTARARYWGALFHAPLEECVALKENSDMGLCQLVRMLYRYGTLPAALDRADGVRWRGGAPDLALLDEFLRAKADSAAAGDQALRDRVRVAGERLRVVIEETSARPRSAAPVFSILAEEVLKTGLRSYKFWLDEPLMAWGHATLNKVKADIGTGTANTEMEFWSENHYLMFASSEYLLGQLWPDEEFQPGREFLPPERRAGVRSGAQRRDRGRARLLRWLENKLMFGWTEHNAPGYYREHLWALLNLVDFSLDEEVHTKATMALDLLLFDVVRYMHRGGIGAPGARSQFKSRNCGWDNAIGDAVEIMLGTRGLFGERSSQIGASFATSTYEVPEVLLEIGSHPPDFAYVDRSRVSISFDEAPRYGITWSQQSRAKDAVWEAYARKRARRLVRRGEVGAEIAHTHHRYGANEDDVVFFWGMSAYFNKQVIAGSMRGVARFGLLESDIFKTLVVWVGIVLPGFYRGLNPAGGTLLEGPIGAVNSIVDDEDDFEDFQADVADDLSVFLEGSTRTRANILCFRTPDVMLASVQDFRPGQLNLQSSVNQATLDGALSVFTTAGFQGLHISEVDTAIAGGLIGGAIGLIGGPIGAVIGAAAGATIATVLVEDNTRDVNPLANDEVDGPSWWTGHWALPMVVQHRSAAILAYQFHDSQELLADCGSHAWFPKAGFDRVVERRTSAYDNADFGLLDLGDVGPKGFWVFGKVTHRTPPGSPEEPGEAYIGVFSNQPSEWLDEGFRLYEREFNKVRGKAAEAQMQAISETVLALSNKPAVGIFEAMWIFSLVDESVEAQRRPRGHFDEWFGAVAADLDASGFTQLDGNREEAKKLARSLIEARERDVPWQKPFPDLFADRDWYIEDKNVWIIQVGSKAEFGSFERFMDQVSSARIHLDDVGDLECTYDIPKGDGSSDRLRLAYGDRESELNGKPFQTDLYPRFENPFVRGGRVEWGQREYCLEWDGRALLHDYSDGARPVRKEAPADDPEAAETIKALAIFLRTGKEKLEIGSAVQAAVSAGCRELVREEVVAAGPAEKNTDHDCEWVFLDASAPRSPDMALTLSHFRVEEDALPDWQATYTLEALMGDHRVYECAVSVPAVSFDDDRRSSGPLPFSVSLSRWAEWAEVPDAPAPARTILARPPGYADGHSDRNDLFALDTTHRLWHRRLSCGNALGLWIPLDAGGVEPDWSRPFSWAAATDRLGTTALFVLSAGRLLVRHATPDGRWSDAWEDLEPHDASIFHLPVPLGADSVVTAVPSGAFERAGISLALTGADGDAHLLAAWRPGSEAGWRRIEAAGAFALAPRGGVHVGAGRLFARDAGGHLWVRPLEEADFLGADWRPLEPLSFAARRLAVADAPDGVLVAVSGGAGEVRVGVLSAAGDFHWAPPPASNWSPAPATDLAWALPGRGEPWLFACGSDGSVRGLNVHGDGSPVGGWAPIGTAERQVAVDASNSGLIAVSRTKGQVEVFVQGRSGAAWTWWS